MNEGEADRIYDELLYALRGTPLGWVADQVSEQVVLGKLEEKKIPVVEADEPELGGSVFQQVPRRRLATVTGSIEYEPKEKLRLLVGAIHRSTIEAASLEIAMARLVAGKFPRRLKDSHQPTSTFSFRDPVDAERDFTSQPEIRQRMATAMEKLGPLLRELTEELDAD